MTNHGLTHVEQCFFITEQLIRPSTFAIYHWRHASDEDPQSVLLILCYSERGKYIFNIVLSVPRRASDTTNWPKAERRILFSTYTRNRGPVVRVAPNELSFISPESWHNIHSMINEKQAEGEFIKDPEFYSFLSAEADSLVTLELAEHNQLRRQVVRGFSERSTQMQEAIFQDYIDLLIRRLRENVPNDSVSIDLREWLTYFSFDIVGKLALGSDFGCLENSKYNPWVWAIVSYTKEWMYLQLLACYGFRWLVSRLVSNPFL